MYNENYRDFEALNEFEDLENYEDAENFSDDFRDDDEEFVEFTPPYACPFYRQPMPGGGYTPPRPPFGPPGGFPGGSQHGQQGGVPTSPPPGFTPQKTQAQSLGAPGGAGVYAVDPGAIRRCRYRYIYIWLRNGNSFWAWLTYVGRTSCAGYRWTGRRWVYFGIDLRRIEGFVCY